jgi:hypothetical protein
MKKIAHFLIFILVYLGSSGIYAQKAKSLWFDVCAGINTSLIINQNAYGNGELDYATTFGFTGGPGTSYLLSDNWGINTSLTWSKLGQNYSGSQSSADAIRKVKLNYLELPLLAMHRIKGTKNPTWIAFGPEFMFLAGAKQDYHRENDGSELPKPLTMVEGNTDIIDRFNPVDIGLNISLKKIYDLYENSKLRLVVTANMAIGLTDMNSKEWQTPNMKGDYSGSHNFYLGIKAGLMYRAYIKED